MTKTQSETLFESFCANTDIPISRVPKENTKTPDYVITPDNQRIIVEVKEMTSNKEEKESDRVRRKQGYGNAISITPGDRIRKKISDSSSQIKARTLGEYPSVLILFDSRSLSDHLSEYNVRVAMYGLEQMHIAAPRDPSISPYATGTSYGPKRKMTKEHNTSISAIGVLIVNSGTETLALRLYHNKHATISLDPKLLQKPSVAQFKLGDEIPGRTADWEEIFVK